MSQQFDFDVIIIGTGPAGMFAALELVELKPGIRIAMLEKGPFRPKGDKSNVTSGWGGAGAFSDGKLNLTEIVGGTVHEHIGLATYKDILAHVDKRYLAFGGLPNRKDARQDPALWARVQALKTKALGAGLDLRPFPIRHLGTDTAFTIVMEIRRCLEAAGVQILTGTRVEAIAPEDGGWRVGTWSDEHSNEGALSARFVLAAPGRSGADWMAGVAKKLGLKLKNNGIDVGVRVEVLNETLAEITDLLYESKLLYQTKESDDQLRTFCMCPSGFVAIENYRGLMTVNGHSESKTGRQSPNTNFAILATQVFTEPFSDSLGYGRDISSLANKLAGGSVLVQRLGDLRQYRRSHDRKRSRWMVQPTLESAVSGDLGLVIPGRHLSGIIEMLDALESIAPGIASKHTLLYGVEVKFYSNQIEAFDGFETALPGLYVAGDGSGYTRGLNQSSVQGVVVARHIANRL